MSPFHFKPWSQRTLEPVIGLLVALVLLPVFVAMVKPLLTSLGLVLIIVMAARGVIAYVVYRQQRW